jgi:uncharacterized Zn ribbon protein
MGTVRSNDSFEIGDNVILTKKVKTFSQTFPKGHRMKLIDLGERGWDLEDKDGNKLRETRMSGDFFVKDDHKTITKNKPCV